MKYLIMTEGICEKALLDLLLERELLIYSRNELLYNEIYHLRQLNTSTYEKISQLDKNEEISIVRVGDKLSDELKINNSIKRKIILIEKVCTKPEFEILHIIHEGKYKDFIKSKSKIKPCEYYKNKNTNYNKTYDFNYKYFNVMSNDELKALLEKYNEIRKKTHQKGTKSLFDILR